MCSLGGYSNRVNTVHPIYGNGLSLFNSQHTPTMRISILLSFSFFSCAYASGRGSVFKRVGPSADPHNTLEDIEILDNFNLTPEILQSRRVNSFNTPQLNDPEDFDMLNSYSLDSPALSSTHSMSETADFDSLDLGDTGVDENIPPGTLLSLLKSRNEERRVNTMPTIYE
jgi:hypothetical protein